MPITPVRQIVITSWRELLFTFGSRFNTCADVKWSPISAAVPRRQGHSEGPNAKNAPPADNGEPITPN
jgi:hypothetical protein